MKKKIFAVLLALLMVSSFSVAVYARASLYIAGYSNTIAQPNGTKNVYFAGTVNAVNIPSNVCRVSGQLYELQPNGSWSTVNSSFSVEKTNANFASGSATYTSATVGKCYRAYYTYYVQHGGSDTRNEWGSILEVK